MKRDTISHTQLTALVWAGVLAPAAELLPAVTLPLAGKGAWLAPAAAIPLVLLGGWLLGGLSREGGLAQAIRETLGPVLGRGVTDILGVLRAAPESVESVLVDQDLSQGDFFQDLEDSLEALEAAKRGLGK